MKFIQTSTTENRISSDRKIELQATEKLTRTHLLRQNRDTNTPSSIKILLNMLPKKKDIRKIACGGDWASSAMELHFFFNINLFIEGQGREHNKKQQREWGRDIKLEPNSKTRKPHTSLSQLESMPTTKPRNIAYSDRDVNAKVFIEKPRFRENQQQTRSKHAPNGQPKAKLTKREANEPNSATSTSIQTAATGWEPKPKTELQNTKTREPTRADPNHKPKQKKAGN